ncbi:hypothetical protein EKG37_21205 [Robertmurraya yapensis]|uniref:Uncharacterized protein n=1 Tax=Bacillus yapensis TaxID=2492960 RepID=A0A431VU55_9BACI|nr:hypothetical protein [Bacillus yapensis]RTR26589.1 hypothetical protein EKG37_21205 [Bacillus yapensis]TKS93764.1 hypothetical protein FAR12_21210 [Bacillus yapensis]
MFVLGFLCVCICVGLFAVSLSLFSKSAEQRARANTEKFYALQIREEAESIRLRNELFELEKSNLESVKPPIDISTEKTLSVQPVTHDLGQEVIDLPVKEVQLKELDLDEKALEFVSKFQPKQEEIQLPNVTVYEEPAAWFSFPEVDLHMNDRPMQGLYYVAGKVMDVLDEMSAVISDGTGERMVYHNKVQLLSVGDVIISQVEVHKSVWHFINIWEVNNNNTEQEVKEAI